MHHVSKLTTNRLNNRDFDIDQNNCDYDFFHNRAALIKGQFNIQIARSCVTNSIMMKYCQAAEMSQSTNLFSRRKKTCLVQMSLHFPAERRIIM